MQRPTSLTVFGILNIVFALLGFCGIAVTLAGPVIQKAAEKAAADAGQQANEDPGQKIQKAIAANQDLQLLGQIQAGLGGIASIVLLIAGIGLLKMQPFGRTLSIGYAIYDILSKIVFMVINLILMMPVFETVQQEAPEAAGALGGLVMGGSACGLIFTLIYPIVLLIFMMRSKVRDAIAGTSGGGGDDMMPIPDDNQY